jgi:hypothetical protein
MKLKFSDGVTIETGWPLRKLHLDDGWYVVGDGSCIPVASEGETDETIVKVTVPKLGTMPLAGLMEVVFQDGMELIACIYSHDLAEVDLIESRDFLQESALLKEKRCV